MADCLHKAVTADSIFVWKKHGFWRSYDAIAALSRYSQNWIRRWWDADSFVLPPPVDSGNCAPQLEKERIILSVGRFFKGGHNKKHDVMITAFKELYDSGVCPGWEFHLCGGTHPESRHQAYLRRITKEAAGYPISIHPDICRQELERLYCRASIFWHAAGFNENEKRWPERSEHFGITTVEAMGAGCIPVVIGKAGQNEIIEPGVNGYSWNTLDELRLNTLRVLEDPLRAKILREGAANTSALFSFDAFSDRLTELLRHVL